MRQALANVHDAHCRVREVCRHARDISKERIGIGIQRQEDGGYQLVACNPVWRGEAVYASVQSIHDWARSVVYRLCRLGLIGATEDDVDEYYAGHLE